MKQLVSLLLLFLLPFCKANYPVKCSQLDFVYATSNCCDENNDATCLQSIPHEKYRADVVRLEDALEEIGLCSENETSCIKDLPSLTYLRDRIKNITDGGVEIAVEVATSKQDKHPNLDKISDGVLPSLQLEGNGTLTIPSGSTLKVEGMLEIPQLSTGATADTATTIGHLKLDELHSAVDFNKHLLSEVNLKSPFQVDSVDVFASAKELNILHGVDLRLTPTEINKLKGLQADAADLNGLHDSNLTKQELQRIKVTTLGVTEPNKIVTTDASGNVVFKKNVEIDGNLDIPYGSLKINGVVVNKTAAQLNDAVAHFIGLTASTTEINTLDGILATSDELNKLHLVTADKDDLNRLDITSEGVTEANKVVTADANGKVTFSHNVDVQGTFDVKGDLRIAGVKVTSSAQELSLLKGIQVTADQLNVMNVTTIGESEPEKALVPDSDGNLKLNGDLTIGDSKTLTVAKDKLHIGSDAVTVTAAELNVLDGVDPGLTAAHLNPIKAFTGDWSQLNILSGVTATTQELNMLDIETLGVSEASKVVTADADNTVELQDLTVKGQLNVTSLVLGGVEVTTSAAQLNQFDGFTADVDSLNKLQGLSVGGTDLNKLKDVTADAQDMNRLDITSEGDSEASKVVTADANGEVRFSGKVKFNGGIDLEDGQLKIGNTLVTATAAEINKLSGMTSTAQELNALHGVTLGQTAASKAVTTDASGKVQFNGDVAIAGDLDIPSGKLKLGGVLLDAAHDGGDINDATNHFLQLTVTAAELNVLDDIQATTAELNKMHLVTATTAELNYLAGLTLGQAQANKVVTTDANNKATIPTVAATTLETDTLKLNGVEVTATAEDLSRLSGLTATSADINKLSGFTGSGADLAKLTGLTASAAELNVLDGVDAGLKSKHLNVLVNVTASAQDLNKLSGLTASVQELDKVKDLTATAAELNVLSSVTPGTVSPGKAVVVDSNGDLSSSGSLTVTGTLDAAVLKIAGTAVTATAADLNSVATLSSQKTKLVDLAQVTSTSAEIDDAVAKAAIVSSADMTKLSQLTATSQQLNTCANFLVTQSGNTPTCTQFGQMIYLTKTNGDTELHFCKSATESLGPLA